MPDASQNVYLLVSIVLCDLGDFTPGVGIIPIYSILRTVTKKAKISRAKSCVERLDISALRDSIKQEEKLKFMMLRMPCLFLHNEENHKQH